jgi:tRNA nucleotidyltransferase (CCA-adding enzyme)
MQQAIDFILDTNQPLSIKDLAVSGTDLLTIGYAPGPFLGETLQRLLEFVLEDPSQNQRELLLHMASVWKDQQL